VAVSGAAGWYEWAVTAASVTGPGGAVGVQLRRHRRRAGLTQEELAARAGLSLRTIHNLESEKVVPRVETIRLLADALGLSEASRAYLVRSAEPPGSGPDQLPLDVPDFTGRADIIAELVDLLAGPPGTAPPVVALVGAPGVGKSTLAVHVARWLVDRFPDGQLYVDLRGGHPPAPTAGEALGQLLRALGPAGQIPADPSERAALYRSSLAGRRTLVILDDAASEGQLRPLLPAAPQCAVLITTRRRLAGLPGVAVVELDVLPAEDGVELLARVAGPDRTAAAPEVAARVVELCDGLPLAIRIAGARLAARPQWPLSRLVSLLEDSRRRLNELATGDLAVRASIDLSYDALPDEDRTALRRLAVLDLPVVPAWAAAAALDAPDPDSAEEAVDRLVDVSLLALAGIAADGSAAHRFHDLLRVYGQELAAVEDSAEERLGVLHRTMSAALGLADEAAAVGPHRRERRPRSTATRIAPTERTLTTLRADPAGWFEEARPTLSHLVRHAAAAGHHDAVWDLSARLLSFFEFGRWFEDWAGVLQAGLAAARLSGPQAVPLLLRGHGDLALAVGDIDEAEQYLRSAAQMSARLGDDDGLGWAHYLLGVSAHSHGRLDEALDLFRRAETAFRAAGEVPNLAHFGMGAVLQERGDTTGALDQFERALAGARAQDDTRDVAHVLRWVAQLRIDLGDLDRARRDLAECTALHRALGDRLGEGYALQLQADLLLSTGELAAARPAADQALAIFVELGSRQGEALTSRTSARCALAAGDAAAARAQALRAVGLYADLEMDLGRGRSFIVVAATEEALGNATAARAARDRALALLAPLGVPEAAELAGKSTEDSTTS
jgi:transcriptional regulator with XRE-family HTH domain/tetratricopeptide (TPR) repeat protein/cyanate lyase